MVDLIDKYSKNIILLKGYINHIFYSSVKNQFFLFLGSVIINNLKGN